MGWPFSAWVGVLGVAIMWPLAALVFFTAPGRVINRTLGAILFLESLAAAGWRIILGIPDPGLALGVNQVAAVSLNILVPLYPLFLGEALDGPLVRPFQHRAVKAGLIGLSITGGIAGILYPTTFGGHLYPVGAGWNSTSTLANSSIALVIGFFFLYNLAASVSAFLRAPHGSLARHQAKLFMLAFGARDLILGPIILYGYGGEIGLWPLPRNFLTPGLALTIGIYGPLLAYALLRHQLFDIDLRIKWTLSRGSLGAIFLGFFLIISKLAEGVAEATLGTRGWVIGAFAAGLLLFALTPLQRWTERLAHRAMPNTTGTDEYIRFKKLEVYRSTVESVVRDGEISSRERATLDRLREKLGIGATTAHALERESLAGFRGARAADS